MRAEFANDLLRSDFFQETIQAMNEMVMEDLINTDPLDKEGLLVLRLRTGVITEFQDTLRMFMAAHEEALVEQERYLRLEEENDIIREQSVRTYTK